MKVCPRCGYDGPEFPHDRHVCKACIADTEMQRHAADRAAMEVWLDDELAAVLPTHDEFVHICAASRAMVAYAQRDRLGHGNDTSFRKGGSYTGPIADDILEVYATKKRYPGTRYIQLAGCAMVLSRFWEAA